MSSCTDNVRDNDKRLKAEGSVVIGCDDVSVIRDTDVSAGLTDDAPTTGATRAPRVSIILTRNYPKKRCGMKERLPRNALRAPEERESKIAPGKTPRKPIPR